MYHARNYSYETSQKHEAKYYEVITVRNHLLARGKRKQPLMAKRLTRLDDIVVEAIGMMLLASACGN